MATKTTTTGNPKQRKQLIFIAIGGVLLLGIAFFEGPKIWKQINPPAPAAQAHGGTGATGAAGPTSAIGGTAVVAAPLTGSAVVVKPSPRPGAKMVVAGVDVQPWQVPQATTGQLWTFSRLQAKDPFVQQVDQKSSITPVAPFGATNSSRTTSTSTATTTTTSQPKQATATTAPAELPPIYATIEVNGNELRLKMDQAFPPATKVFELAALKPKSAEIVLSNGGKIGKNGKLILTMGKPLTLVNATTGKRYTLKLLYTGSKPEVVQQFSTKAK